MCRCMDQSNLWLLEVLACWAHVFPQNCPFTFGVGIVTPRNTLFLRPSPLVISIWHLDRFNRFCMGPKCYVIQCIVSGEENPQNCSFPLGLCYPQEEDWATAIGNMHKNLVKITHVVCKISLGQTDRRTHRRVTGICRSGKWRSIKKQGVEFAGLENDGVEQEQTYAFLLAALALC